jgi:hypothetical protein
MINEYLTIAYYVALLYVGFKVGEYLANRKNKK